MKCFTIKNPPEIVEGIRAEHMDKEGIYLVRMGKICKLSNQAILSMFSSNPPDIQKQKQGNNNIGIIHDANPVEITTSAGKLFALAKPEVKETDILLVRFFMGSLIDDKYEENRASVWPETGNPTLISYTCIAAEIASWPLWSMDCIYTCSPGDIFHVQGPKYSYRVLNIAGRLEIKYST